MSQLPHLLANNRRWADRMRAANPKFFENLSQLQAPKYLWIGCADSRVPANEIVGLLPGELFVHRNVANVVVHTDLNCLSVIHFAVAVLRVRHIIVCGHYGCGGVRAALNGTQVGVSENWLRHVEDVRRRNARTLAELADDDARADRLCELNVIEQAMNVCLTSVVSEAWQQGHPLDVHGWIYSLRDGLLRDVRFHAQSEAAALASYDTAADALARGLRPETAA
ncbi:MAG: carbonate dehydratase [Verrucomicrobia bacterium]|nr:carbonate dehydratase [Verrucomicrobiota bacterium]